MGCPISWQPNALEPVFYGIRDETARVRPRALIARAASWRVLPRALATLATLAVRRRFAITSPIFGGHRCRVFFPSLEGSPFSAPTLEEECGRYPLIVFVHGMCGEPDHYKKWEYLPAQLARGGHVVVVPELRQIAGGTDPQQADGDLSVLGEVITWIRTESAYRAIVAPAPITGIVGHSYGGGLAARFVATNPGAISAFASMSGVSGVGISHVAAAPIAKLFMWGSDQLMDAALVDMNPAPSSATWNAVSLPKHSAIFNEIGHWDYLPAGTTACDAQRGQCGRTPALAAELLMMFFGRYLTAPGAPNLLGQIGPRLIPPRLQNMALSQDQQFFAGGYLYAFENLSIFDLGCQVRLAWDAGGGQAGTAMRP
ncbi:MAG TPA: alpha/beta fold hydrolase [Gaiellaceae bacterium]|jgi:pimeloyl-ACP methyl ester carboxylesterase|nr:alpha/beta fold hydrolase [Gaiellaceae bacterium]